MPEIHVYAAEGRSVDQKRQLMKEITDSTTRNNPKGTFETPDLPGFYVIAKGPAQVDDSMILR